MVRVSKKATRQQKNPENTIELELPDPFEDMKRAFKVDINHTLDEVQNAKKDFIAIFGLFAAVLIFLSLEVKIFDQSQRIATTMGISFFFLSALLTFVLAIRSIYTEKNSWREFTKPAFVFALIFLIIALECFYWSDHASGVSHHAQFWFFGSR